MANLFSDLLTSRDTAGDITDQGTYSGGVKVTRAIFNVTANPGNDDVIMMVDLPSNAKPGSIQMFNEDIGNGSAINVGIFAGEQFTDTDVAQTFYNKNDAIEFNAFDDASVDLNLNNTSSPVELRFQIAGVSTSLSRLNETMWELAGLNSDPIVNMRIGIDIDTNWSVFVGGFITYIVKYTVK